MSDRPTTPAGRVKRTLAELAVAVGVTAATLLALEGGASALLLQHDLRAATRPPARARPLTVPDTLLGWRNAAGLARPDEYGRGVALGTTADGLRRTPDATASTVRARVACTGDSYTFGVGVADDRHWCALLPALLPGVQTADMAQPSYGLDQLLLWYRRDGARVPHDVQLLAVTHAELERAVSDDDAGWPKPRLALDGGRLVTRGVPVPPAAGAMRSYRLGEAVGDLRLVQALHRIPSLDPDARTAARIDDAHPLFEAMLDELAATHRGRHTRLVLAYLPTMRDARPGPRDARRAWLAAAAARRAIPFLDLTPALRTLRPDSLDLAFIARTSPLVVPRAVGQYSTVGHAWVARQLAARLDSLLPGLPNR